MTHPHPAAVAAAEKIGSSYHVNRRHVGSWIYQVPTDELAAIISDAITAALSAPSPVGDGPSKEAMAAGERLSINYLISHDRPDMDPVSARDIARDIDYQFSPVRCELAALREQVRALEVDNLWLRKRVCFASAGPHGYYDDGEFQDNRFPAIDWKRDSIADIKVKIERRQLEALAAIEAARPATEGQP